MQTRNSKNKVGIDAKRNNNDANIDPTSINDRCKKRLESVCETCDPKFINIESWSGKGSPKWLRVFDDMKFLGWRGPQDQLKIGPFDRKNIHIGSRHAKGPNAQRI